MIHGADVTIVRSVLDDDADNLNTQMVGFLNTLAMPYKPGVEERGLVMAINALAGVAATIGRLRVQLNDALRGKP